jgi:succinate dehydrogenase / fumarate reductase cytochrome b subunit
MTAHGLAEGKRGTYPNRLGIFRWLSSGRRGIEAYLYVGHRVTGLVLLSFLCAHVFVTATRLLGEEAWARLMRVTHSPVFEWLEYLVFAAFAFHALNGVRLILVELGFAVGRPEQPAFPFKTSVHKQRPLMIVLMIFTAALIALGGFDLLRFPD